MQKLGLCFLGCGEYAKVVAESTQPLLDQVTLFFASRNLIKAKLYSTKFNGSGSFGCYTQAVHDPNVQAVYICTPHHLHLEHVRLATASGKHILLEKPIANTLESAQAIASLGQESGITLMVAENYRYMPSIRLCKKLIDEGAIGKIRIIQIQEEFYSQPRGWRLDHESNGGGVFVDGGIHKVHFLRYLLGDPRSIYSLKPPSTIVSSEREDGLLFTCQWETGEIGTIYHSWTGSLKNSPHWIKVSGTEGSIYFEIGGNSLELSRMNSTISYQTPEHKNGILPMFLEFICSINENREPETTAMEGLKDLRIVTQAYESIAKGGVVLIPNII